MKPFFYYPVKYPEIPPELIAKPIDFETIFKDVDLSKDTKLLIVWDSL